MTSGEKKELSKVEAFKEHSIALKRHMENTGAYLKKEVKSVEAKIDEAHALMLSGVGVRIDDASATDLVLSASEDSSQVKEILEELEDDEEESFTRHSADMQDMDLIPEPPLQPPTPQQQSLRLSGSLQFKNNNSGSHGSLRSSK